jgi:hypothetical protein
VNITGPDDNETVSAQVSRNADCTYDYVVRRRREEPRDGPWIKWDSEVAAKDGSVAKFHHGLKVFHNLDAVPQIPDGAGDVQISVSLNEHCKYDGKITYSQLYAWTSSAGGASGGIQNGTRYETVPYIDATGKVKLKKVKTKSVRVFYGTGNEGTEAATAASADRISGSGRMRVYESDS